MPKPIDWSSVNSSEFEKIEKFQSVDFKLQYKVNYMGRSVTLESLGKLEKSKIQKLALKRFMAQDLELLSPSKRRKVEVEAKQHQDALKVTTTAPNILPKKAGINQLLEMAPPLRDLVLKSLTYEDLLALNEALPKYLQTQKELEPNFSILKRQINTQKEFHLKERVNETLKDQPGWATPEWTTAVNGWKNVTFEDKLWLLQLYELCNLGVQIPQIPRQGNLKFFPSSSSPELLKPDARIAITAALNKVTKLQWSAKQLQKCTRAICLLKNLQSLDLTNNRLTTPPDVSKNVNLEKLKLRNNLLTHSPDVSKNVKLQDLYLENNRLTVPPEVSKNVNLETLNLMNNQLTILPDVSRNVHLRHLLIEDNSINKADIRRIEDQLRVQYRGAL